jgi:hypothetical protein
MKLILSLFIAMLTSFASNAQEKITYQHCNCTDIIETLNPKPHGKYTRTCDSKLIETGTFLNGQKDGEWKSYSKEGTLIKTIHYSNGVLNGEVLFNYSSGKKKLSGNFSNGLKNGYWAFYSQEDKIQWDLTYQEGKPTGNAQSYDSKGKKVLISFNFETGTYLKNSSDFNLFDGDPSVLQDASSTGWFLLFHPGMEENAVRLKLDQTNTDSQIFLSMMEIPSEFFDTYLKTKYVVNLSFQDYSLKTLQVEREKEANENAPVFPFAVITNDADKLTRMEHSDFSMLLLDSKVKETFSLIQPWQIKNGDFQIIFYFIINEIEGREAFDEK